MSFNEWVVCWFIGEVNISGVQRAVHLSCVVSVGLACCAAMRPLCVGAVVANFPTLEADCRVRTVLFCMEILVTVSAGKMSGRKFGRFAMVCPAPELQSCVQQRGDG